MIERARNRSIYDWFRDGVSVGMLITALVGVGSLIERDKQRAAAQDELAKKLDQLIVAHNELVLENTELRVMVEQSLASRVSSGERLGGKGSLPPRAGALKMTVTPLQKDLVK